MKTDYKMTALKRPADEQLAEIKQALVDKGLATEDTPSSELSGVINNSSFLKPLLDATKKASYLFKNAQDLTDASLYIKYEDTSNVRYMDDMFYGCGQLTIVPEMDTSNVENMSYMFNGCTRIKTIPQFNTSKVNTMHSMFKSCSNLTTIPEMNTSKVAAFTSMFEGCRNLITVPKMDVSKAYSLSDMFDSCLNLTTITYLDMKNITNTNDTFRQCTKLTELNIYNIKANLQIGSGTSYGHLLTLDSLINTCKECIKQSSSKTLTIGTANLEKIANVYVKFTNPSQTTIATGEKGDVVVCESTDEGAMTITEYMTLKNWTLA